MQSVVVTGCLGYVGSVLCRELLSHGYYVVGIDNCRYGNGDVLSTLLWNDRFLFMHGDIRFPSKDMIAAIKHSDFVIPLAALVGAPVCDKYPFMATEVNLHAVKEVIRVMGAGQLLLYPNTNSGYGQTDGSSFCTEEDELKPISRYARDKCEVEQYIRDTETNAVVFRLATVFGVSPRMRMDLMVNDFTRRLTYLKRDGFVGDQHDFKVFDANYYRNFVHVLDVARAFIHAMERNLTGVYNLGNPSANATKLDLAHLICDHIGLSREVVTTGEGHDQDQRNYLVSNKKILATRFTFQNSLLKGVDEVHKLCLAMSQSKTNEMRNV